MDRTRAIEIARRCAKAKPQNYYSEPFQPHEWVIDAIMEALDADPVRAALVEALGAVLRSETGWRKKVEAALRLAEGKKENASST